VPSALTYYNKGFHLLEIKKDRKSNARLVLTRYILASSKVDACCRRDISSSLGCRHEPGGVGATGGALATWLAGVETAICDAMVNELEEKCAVWVSWQVWELLVSRLHEAMLAALKGVVVCSFELLFAAVEPLVSTGELQCSGRALFRSMPTTSFRLRNRPWLQWLRIVQPECKSFPASSWHATRFIHFI